MSDFYPRLFEKFEEGGDPVKQMGIGLSDEEVLLELTVQLFVDKVMCRKMTKKEESQLKGIPPYFVPEHYLRMLKGDWAKLKKADIDLADNIGTTPLMISIYFSKNSVAVILIENGADVNKPSKNGFTPLMAASSTGNTEMVKLLLEKNADPSAKDNGGLDAAYLASKDEIRALLKSAIKKTKKK